jgi:hypothetical protein
MKPIAFLTIPLLLANDAALAGPIEGNGALALAALVAEHSPGVTAFDKNALAKFLNGYANVRSQQENHGCGRRGHLSGEQCGHHPA